MRESENGRTWRRIRGEFPSVSRQSRWSTALLSEFRNCLRLLFVRENRAEKREADWQFQQPVLRWIRKFRDTREVNSHIFLDRKMVEAGGRWYRRTSRKSLIESRSCLVCKTGWILSSSRRQIASDGNNRRGNLTARERNERAGWELFSRKLAIIGIGRRERERDGVFIGGGDCTRFARTIVVIDFATGFIGPECLAYVRHGSLPLLLILLE